MYANKLMMYANKLMMCGAITRDRKLFVIWFHWIIISKNLHTYVLVAFSRVFGILI